jgi:hypothetical protein
MLISVADKRQRRKDKRIFLIAEEFWVNRVKGKIAVVYARGK